MFRVISKMQTAWRYVRLIYTYITVMTIECP